MCRLPDAGHLGGREVEQVAAVLWQLIDPLIIEFRADSTAVVGGQLNVSPGNGYLLGNIAHGEAGVKHGVLRVL